jgi:hypothetical protein
MLSSILPGIVKYCLNRTNRHSEHICDLFGGASMVKITNYRVCRKPGILKDGDSADLTGNAFNQLAAVPINSHPLLLLDRVVCITPLQRPSICLARARQTIQSRICLLIVITGVERHRVKHIPLNECIDGVMLDH